MALHPVRPESLFLRRDDLLGREIEGEYILYDPRTETVHVLNHSARFVWERCHGQQSAAETVAEISTESGVPVGRAAEDVYRTISDLLERQLIRAL